MAKRKVIRQQDWTDQQLKTAGFEKYNRKKTLIMARRLPASEAPKTFKTSSGDPLIAQAGHVICYEPGDKQRASYDDYPQWPVEPKIFFKTYRPWDDENWKPNAAEKHLMKLGCKPCFKAEGVWAKQIGDEDSLWLQSLESPKPERVASGRVVAIGADGEPYQMGETTFKSRYVDAAPSGVKGIVQRLVRFFTGGK